MTQLLLRLFVKDYRNTEDPAVRTRYGKLAGIVGIVCNVLLSAGKLLAGTLSGAVSITADGLNNLSDAASSLVTLLGFRLAERPADEEHPFGHARMEYLSGLFVSVLILLVGAELGALVLRKDPAPRAGGVFGSELCRPRRFHSCEAVDGAVLRRTEPPHRLDRPARHGAGQP